MAVTITGDNKKALAKIAPALKSNGPVVIAQVIKGDTYLVLSDSAREPEDEYKNLYYTQELPNNVLIAPPYEPKRLASLITLNNILSQCVEAMEVNIDGTGYEFEPVDEDTEMDKAELKRAKSFFQQPYPDKSFVQIRRTMRRELESQGFSFIEVLRNVKGDIVGLRNTVSHMMRYVRLGAPVTVTKEILRDGVPVELTMKERERSFVQRFGADNVFYREFGTTRQINSRTGEWESPEKPVLPTDRGTELLVFLVNPDIETPYGIPRWINQLPSVLGSRKAEEQNLEFFDAGGMPPAIIFIQGGTMAKDMSDQLKLYLSGQAKSKNRAVVVEAQSSSGSLDAAGSVQVKVERFGAERANDAMYANYDKTAEEHVRTGFRLPPLFLGKAADYNFATAQTAYMVAEAQVFQPERMEFDEYITATIIRGLGVKTLKLRSNPITLKDVQMQLTALGVVKDVTEPESLVGEVNKIASVTLEYKAPEMLPNGQPATAVNQAVFLKQMDQAAAGVKPDEDKAPTKPQEKAPEKSKAAKGAMRLMELAHAYSAVVGLAVQKQEMSETRKQQVQADYDALDPRERDIVLQMVASYTSGSNDADFVGLLRECAH